MNEDVYAVYKDGHSEYVGAYHWTKSISRYDKLWAVWHDLGGKSNLARLVILDDGQWCVFIPSKMPTGPEFAHPDLDAALMWATLNCNA